MLQAVKILFLGLAILFSFGFRSYESTCQFKVEQSCEAKSCCKKEAKENPSSEKKDCKGKCCVQAISLLKLDEFVPSTTSIQFKAVAGFNSSFKIEKSQLEGLKQLSFTHSYLTKYEVPYAYFKPVVSAKIQCWLI